MSIEIIVPIGGILGLIYATYLFINVKTVDHGYRSITAVPYPLNINTAKKDTIEALPSIGKKRSVRLILNRPYKSKNEIIKLFDNKEIGKELLNFISIW